MHFIDNRFVPSVSERQFTKQSPVDGSLVGAVAEGGRRRSTRRLRQLRRPSPGPGASSPWHNVPTCCTRLAHEIERALR